MSLPLLVVATAVPTIVKMPQVNEEAIRQALQDLRAGRYSSIRSAARTNAVDRNTLSNCM
jgi:hypothetical protein